MPFDADAIIDRRTLRKRVTFWRVMSVLIGVVALAGAGLLTAGRMGLVGGAAHVARVEVKGFIGSDPEMLRLLDRIRRNSNVRALVVTVDSPGGTVAGSEGLYTALRAVAAAKPTVAVVDGVAASGGYLAAIGADHIVARETAITGSIGVIVQFPDVSRLLGTLGVTVDSVRSSPLKAQPSGFEPTSAEARAALNEIVTDSYQWFQRLVRERRSLTDDELRVASDGRVFSGARARGMKLVDAIGGEPQAREWLSTRDVGRDMPIRTYRPERSRDLPFINMAAAAIVEALGLADIGARLRATGLATQIERATLDGLLAVWQPPTP